MGEGRTPVPRRTRAWVAGAVLFLVVLSVMNLVLVVEGTPEVDPERREGRTWQTGTGAPEQEGRHTWTFSVDPQGSRIVELGVSMPYSVRVTHVSGEATLVHDVGFWIDGERVAGRADQVEAGPQGNASERISRTRTVVDAFDTDLRVERGGAAEGPFVLLVTWDWRVEKTPDADVTFQTVLRPVAVEPVDTGGLPGCGSGCARGLLVVALVGQGASFVWYKRAPAGS